MDTHSCSPRLALVACGLFAVGLAALSGGCARTSKLTFVAPLAPVVPKAVVAAQDSAQREGEDRETPTRPIEPLRAMFADTLIGFQPGTADSAKRYLGRLRHGYTADTLNVVLLGDNRPSCPSPDGSCIEPYREIHHGDWLPGGRRVHAGRP